MPSSLSELWWWKFTRKLGWTLLLVVASPLLIVVVVMALTFALALVLAWSVIVIALQFSFDRKRWALWRAWWWDYRVRGDYGSNQDIALAQPGDTLALLSLDAQARSEWKYLRFSWLRACRRAQIATWRIRAIACLTS